MEPSKQWNLIDCFDPPSISSILLVLLLKQLLAQQCSYWFHLVVLISLLRAATLLLLDVYVFQRSFRFTRLLNCIGKVKVAKAVLIVVMSSIDDLLVALY